MKRTVRITGSALLCARGTTPQGVAQALWNGECGSATRQLGERSFPFFALPLNEPDWLKRAEQAVRQVVGQLGPIEPETPLFIASSSHQIGHFEQQARAGQLDMPQQSASFSRQLSAWAGLSGPSISVSNACISGFSAIDAARSLIAAGQIDEAIVLGVELANDSTLAGFAAMELLSRQRCMPFAPGRDGLVLGEAVAAVRLSAKPGDWRIAGLRTGIDAYSTTGPDPDGGPIARLAFDCLNEARLKPADIELLKLQAAGSPGTDLAEANALRQIFGNAVPPLISFKPSFGHTLGASGIAELATLIACLDGEKIPATPGFAQTDPEIGLQLTVDRSNAYIERAMLNLVGFGGGLATMIIERQS